MANGYDTRYVAVSIVFFFKQKTAYEMRISDWSSDVCSSDLDRRVFARAVRAGPRAQLAADALVLVDQHDAVLGALVAGAGGAHGHAGRRFAVQARAREVQGHRRLRRDGARRGFRQRSEAHTSELQSIMRTSYDVFCLK